jgi:hypothetical protein
MTDSDKLTSHLPILSLLKLECLQLIATSTIVYCLELTFPTYQAWIAVTESDKHTNLLPRISIK